MIELTGIVSYPLWPLCVRGVCVCRFSENRVCANAHVQCLDVRLPMTRALAEAGISHGWRQRVGWSAPSLINHYWAPLSPSEIGSSPDGLGNNALSKHCYQALI